MNDDFPELPILNTPLTMESIVAVIDSAVYALGGEKAVAIFRTDLDNKKSIGTFEE